MENEVLEVSFELEDGIKQTMNIQEVEKEDWEEVESGIKGLMFLVDGQQLLIEISSADSEGVSFKIKDSKTTYFHEENVVSKLFVEVKKS